MDNPINPEESRKIQENPDIPVGDKVINLDASRFEKSKYASQDDHSKFRIKDIAVIKSIAPKAFDAAAKEVKEYSDQLFQNRASGKKSTWRKLGSVPTVLLTLRPELAFDKAAWDKFFLENPEYKTKDK